MEYLEYISHFRFVFHEKYPSDVSVIINERDKPSSARQIFDSRWSPNITMKNRTGVMLCMVGVDKRYECVLIVDKLHIEMELHFY